MAGLDRDWWPCPFCDKGNIEVMIKSSVFSAKRTSCRAGRGTTMRKTKSQSFVVSDKCPVCGKTDEEIEKKWREDGLF